MDSLDMAVQVRPAAECLFAGFVGAIVVEEELCFIADRLVVIFDTQGFVLTDNVGFLELNEWFVVEFGEHNPFRFRLSGILDGSYAGVQMEGLTLQ